LIILQIKTLIESINTQLAGELLSIRELKDFVDKAVDDINTRLNTKFPVLSDILDGVKVTAEDGTVVTKIPTEYNAIPDKYIRTVVIPGATFKYYTTDEEGAAVAPKYEEEYLKGLFYMERDYMPIIPEEYLETDDQGHLHDPHFAKYPYCRKEGEFTIDGSVFQL
jgi:hypothetical protein